MKKPFVQFNLKKVFELKRRLGDAQRIMDDQQEAIEQIKQSLYINEAKIKSLNHYIGKLEKRLNIKQ